MSTSKTILFFGTEDFSAASLNVLIENGYHIAAVVTKPDSIRGRGHQLVEPAVKKIAHRHNIEVWQPHKLVDIIPKIASLQPVTGVLASYGKIIPQTVLDLFEPGIINVHPSLLPEYRGPSPIESAILNGDRETGVSIIKLTSSMDAGPIYAQSHYPLNGDETKPELYGQLAEFGADLLKQVLPDILTGSLTPLDQDDARASYTHLLSKQDGQLSPSDLTAAEAEKHVRAYLGYPKTRLSIGSYEIIVTKCHVAQSGDTVLDVKCKDGTILSIDELIAPSGRLMNKAAFLNGYQA